METQRGGIGLRASPAMKTASAILTYHSLDDSGSAISTHPNVFRAQIECFLNLGIPIVPLRDVFTTPGSLALTFDDGYRNFLEFGYPVLEKYGLPATLFLISGCCGGPGTRFMGIPELRGLSGSGVEMGAHTVHHPDLTVLPEEDAAREIEESRLRLEDWLGCAVDAFAYPYGRSTPGVRRMVERHFKLACGTSLGFLSGEGDRFDLPRLDMYYLRQRPVYTRLMKLGGRAYLGLRRVLRAVSSQGMAPDFNGGQIRP